MKLILLGFIGLSLQAQTILCGSATDQYFSGGAVWPSPVLRYGTFSYQIPVADGAYRVTLTFVEPSGLAAGQRKFDVVVNGVTALSNYDVAAVTTGQTPIQVVLPAVAMNGGGIKLQFVTRLRNAMVSVISIAPGPWVMADVGPAATGIAVVGFTATQAILAYEAPVAPEVCKIEVSESVTYRPLVHDVDPVLFPGSDLDPLVGQMPGGTGRMVTVGKRLTATGADGINYSRALQAGTKHYVRISCGAVMRVATFTTQSLLAGTTFNDGPQVDRARPGQWMMPTRLEDRAQTIVDPQTGALLHAVSIAEEGRLPTFNGIFLSYGGFVRMCDPKQVGPDGGPLGFVCTFLRYGQGGGVAYWIVPATGEVRLLGNVPITGAGPLGSLVTHTDGSVRTYGPNNFGETIWENYTGNFQPATELPVDGWHTYSTVPIADLMQAFDPAYDPARFGCQQAWAAAGKYAMFVCGSGQDFEGWVGVLYGGDGRAITAGCTDGNACPRVVAAVNIFTQAPTLNCTLHNVQEMGDTVSINVQTLPNAPRCAAMGSMVYWRFKSDPHGAALVVDRFFDGGGHWDFGPLGRISEDGAGWAAVLGTPLEAHLDQPITRIVEDSPYFAGARGLSWAATASKHPSYHQVAGVAPAGELGWLLDFMPFDGGQFYSPSSGADPVSGQLYKYNLSVEQPSAALARKQVATLAISGGRALVDISGPGSAIGDTAADSFKYCVALMAEECRAGSQPGEIWVNAPNVSTLHCAGADGPVPDRADLCVGNMGAYQQAMVQADVSGAVRPRVITYGLSGIRNSFYYSTAKSLPDASWALFHLGVVKQGFGDVSNVWMAKLPPLVEDHVDRGTFARMPVALVAPAGTATAVVEFGYLEHGSVSDHFCTSRRETCVATGTVSDAVPFAYASEAFAGMPCAVSCTIPLPVIPGHVAYYRAKYLDGSGKTVGMGQDQIGSR